MLDFIINVIKELGMWGLFAGNALEASSLPFPGALITLTYGYLLEPTWGKLITLAIISSLIYTIFSYIPYMIGYKLKHAIKDKTSEKSTKKVEKAQKWFRKYGVWSIALSRPLGIGNYVSYVSGISKVNKIKFGMLTLTGIFPVTFIMLIIGKNGHLKSVQAIMSSVQNYLFGGGAILLITFIAYKFLYSSRKANKASSENISPSFGKQGES
ncbi:VTT domain-containing protein [Rossellomorea aquimaris]|uniref:DedA family protein n=1 Tax=Rossellomorea aquimaris TaxID=189382 RepID=UPI001CD39404|nr:VTT domain-containing protein [Rossellomorea aquimaris]MCA1053612.1 VTT domain-containing protein [Rossellomorea aquimaris]